jgi:hypothetical protein
MTLRHQVRKVLAHHLSWLVTKDLPCGRIYEQDGTLVVDQNDAVSCRIGQNVEGDFALAHSISRRQYLSIQPVGNIGRGTNNRKSKV